MSRCPGHTYQNQVKLSELMVAQSRIQVKFTAFYVASKTCGASGRETKYVIFYVQSKGAS